MLERIVGAKRREVELLKQSLNRDLLISDQLAVPRPALTARKGLQVIAEVKKASPLKGVLGTFSEPGRLAAIYEENGASAVSVITDREFFQGSKDYVQAVLDSTCLPVLRKDFIIDEIQLLETCRLGASMVLLIAALHSYGSLLAICEKAGALGLEPLLEIHDDDELDLLKDLPVRLVGVNNRNLKTFEVNLATSLRLVEHMDDALFKISESGIKSGPDMAVLEAAGFQAVLIGEALVTATHPGDKLKELLNYAEGERP
ncbi:MAG: indole-3-glycerol phosphate synthase TrpC [Syntrophomonadaceae bacterium]